MALLVNALVTGGILYELEHERVNMGYGFYLNQPNNR
jgi:hypothetical protein